MVRVIFAAERVALQLSPRRAAQDDLKKGTISRAEGGQLQAPVGRSVLSAVCVGVGYRARISALTLLRAD